MTDGPPQPVTDPTPDAAAPVPAAPPPAEPDHRDLRVVILNQYYWPDVASTGHLLHELANDLARREVAVSVLTGRPSYGPRETWQPAPLRERTGGVDVARMITTRFSKDNILGRVLNSITFLAPLTMRVLLRPNRDEVFLYTTNPPYLGIIGALVSRLRKHRYVVLLHDSYPHIAVLIGKLGSGGMVERIWHRLNRSIYQRAEQTIVLCDRAKDLVCREYDVDPGTVHVIPNWADGTKLFPIDKAKSPFAREHELLDVFTVLYSGNLGLYYEFETILKAAELLKDEPFRLVLVGAGGKKEWIRREIEQRGLSNTLLLPYQPFETLNQSLNACDASLVTIDRGVEGISFPSKLYSSLAVGKPILALSEDSSELRDIVDRDQVGRWFELGDAEGVAAACRELMADPERCRTMGANARRLFEQRYNLEAAGSAYARVLAMAAPDAPDTPGAPASAREAAPASTGSAGA